MIINMEQHIYGKTFGESSDTASLWQRHQLNCEECWWSCWYYDKGHFSESLFAYKSKPWNLGYDLMILQNENITFS